MSKQLLLQDGAEFCDSSSLLAAPNSYDILLSMGRSEINNRDKIRYKMKIINGIADSNIR